MNSPNSRLSFLLSLHSGEAVAVRLVAVGLGVVERLHLLSAGPLVSGRLFHQQGPAVVKQVTRQQEPGQRQDQQAEVDLKDIWMAEMERLRSYSSPCVAELPLSLGFALTT